MMERVGVDDVDERLPREDSMDTQDSLIHGPAGAAMSLADTAGDMTGPLSLGRGGRGAVDESSRRASSSAESKPTTDTSTLPIRGIRSPPGTAHRLITTGPAQSVRDTAGKPVGECSQLNLIQFSTNIFV